MKIRSFGKLSDGRSAGLYILSNNSGTMVCLTDYGAAVVSLFVPDRDGKLRDVVLGYEDVSGYEKGQSFFGGTVGRYANRISNASFDLNGRHYILTANEGPNTLHGGKDFYVHRLWTPVISFRRISTREVAAAYAVESMNDWSRESAGREHSVINSVTDYEGMAEAPEPQGDSITFVLDSPDGDQGFPGDLHVEVTYTLTDDNQLHIDYRARLDSGQGKSAIRPDTRDRSRDGESSDSGRAVPVSEIEIEATRHDTLTDEPDEVGIRRQATPVNLTNHSYFNLNGHDSGSVLGHYLSINADRFTETDRRSIPTGSLLDVRWTPMDFRKSKPIGQDIDQDYEPLRFGNGYDHNYVLNAEGSEAACLYSDDSGIVMSVRTDLPGVQMYTGNGLSAEPGKDGAVYGRRSAVCLETQFWPDTINKEHFPGGVLTAGEEFTSRTTYSFSVRGRE